MLLTEAQVKAYEEDGFLLLPHCFSEREIEAMVPLAEGRLLAPVPGGSAA